MVEFFYSREARLDLLEIWEYIAADNVDVADRVEQEIQRAVMLLALNPGLGRFDFQAGPFLGRLFLPCHLGPRRAAIGSCPQLEWLS